MGEDRTQAISVIVIATAMFTIVVNAAQESNTCGLQDFWLLKLQLGLVESLGFAQAC